MVSPPSRKSIRASTGTRVPTKTGVPPRISGSVWTICFGSMTADRIALPRPHPVPNLRQVVAELADVLAVLDQFVAHLLLHVRVARGEAGHAVDDVDDQVKAIEVVEHRHVERRRGRP